MFSLNENAIKDEPYISIVIIIYLFKNFLFDILNYLKL